MFARRSSRTIIIRKPSLRQTTRQDQCIRHKTLCRHASWQDHQLVQHTSVEARVEIIDLTFLIAEMWGAIHTNKIKNLGGQAQQRLHALAQKRNFHTQQAAVPRSSRSSELLAATLICLRVCAYWHARFMILKSHASSLPCLPRPTTTSTIRG